MAEDSQSLGFTKEELTIINKAFQIILSRDTESKAKNAPSDYLEEIFDKAKDYFSTRLENQIAVLSLSIAQGSSPLGRINEGFGCSNNCAAACKISCVNHCNGNCGGSCRGACQTGCEGLCQAPMH